MIFLISIALIFALICFLVFGPRSPYCPFCGKQKTPSFHTDPNGGPTMVLWECKECGR